MNNYDVKTRRVQGQTIRDQKRRQRAALKARNGRSSRDPMLEQTAPVAFKSEACRMADETGLPMTVYAVADRECNWFQVHNEWFPESRTVKAGDLEVAGIVTYLPSRYFVR